MITFPADVEAYVESQLSNGLFPSRDALVVEAIRLHREKQSQLARLKADIQVGLDQLDQGLGTPLDIEEIIRELEEELDDEGRPRCRE